MGLTPGGKIQGISLPAFLQMVQMEKSTCTLTVQSKKSRGVLFIRDGEVIDAQFKDFMPLEAAYEVLCLPDPVIHMEKDCVRTERNIRVPMMHLLMEGTRRLDERGNQIPEDEDFPEEEDSDATDDGSPEPRLSMEPPAPPHEDPDLAGLAAYQFSDDEFRQAAQTDFTHGLPISALRKEPSSPHLPSSPAAPTEPVAPPPPVKKPSPSGRKKVLILSLLLGLLLTGGSVAGFFIYKAHMHNEAYARLQEALLRMELPEQQESVISRFIETFPKSPHVPDLQHARDRLRDVTLDRDYREFLNEEEKLMPGPENFEKALRLYQRFLARHKDGEKADTARRMREERIAAMARDLAAMDKDAMPEPLWLEQARDFISRFPENAGIGVLENSIRRRADAHMDHIFRLPIQSPETRSEAIAAIRIFLRSFPGHAEEAKIQQRLDQLLREERIASLQTTASGLRDHEEQLRFYEKTRRDEKDPQIQAFLQQRVTELRQKVDEDRIWQQVLADVQRPALTDASRIAILDRYLLEAPPERYRSVAEKERNRLAQKLATLEKQLREERARQEALTLQRQQEEERARAAAARLRLESALREMNQRLGRVQGRFRNLGNGTVLDTRNEKTWMLTDSEAYTGRCLNFEEARIFADNLDLGGRGDWRLPTETELAVLFKNPPAYPLPHPDRWYWSGEMISRGYQNEVRVVTAKAENILQRQNRHPEDCGHVLAVRP